MSTALDRVIVERDHACQELIHVAREKVTALVNYSELSTLVHTCLTKKSPQASFSFLLPVMLTDSCCAVIHSFTCMQGTLVDENGTTHCEILRKYEQAVAENTTLRFQIQDATTAIKNMQQDVESATKARDIEHDRAEMLHEIVEAREEELTQIASAADEKQEVCTSSLMNVLYALPTYLFSYCRWLSLTRMRIWYAGCDRTAGDSQVHGDTGGEQGTRC